MSQMVSNLPLTDEIKIVLTGSRNRFRDIDHTLLLCEKGRWDEFSECATKLEIAEKGFRALYSGAVRWVSQVLELSPTAIK